MKELLKLFIKPKSTKKLIHFDVYGYWHDDGRVTFRVLNPQTEMPIELFAKIATSISEVQKWWNQEEKNFNEKEEKK